MPPLPVPPAPRSAMEDSVTIDLSPSTGRLSVDCRTCATVGVCVDVDAEGVAEARRFLHDHANCLPAEADRVRHQTALRVRSRVLV